MNIRKRAYLSILGIVFLAYISIGCQTILKDKEEIEKVAEDAAQELIEDAIKLA